MLQLHKLGMATNEETKSEEVVTYQLSCQKASCLNIPSCIR